MVPKKFYDETEIEFQDYHHMKGPFSVIENVKDLREQRKIQQVKHSHKLASKRGEMCRKHPFRACSVDKCYDLVDYENKAFEDKLFAQEKGGKVASVSKYPRQKMPSELKSRFEADKTRLPEYNDEFWKNRFENQFDKQGAT